MASAFSYIKSQRGKDKLIFDGYIYKQDCSRNEKTLQTTEMIQESVEVNSTLHGSAQNSSVQRSAQSKSKCDRDISALKQDVSQIQGSFGEINRAQLFKTNDVVS